MMSHTFIGYTLLFVASILLFLILSPEWLLKKAIDYLLKQLVSFFIFVPYLLILLLIGITPQNAYVWLNHQFTDTNVVKLMAFIIIALHFVALNYIADKLTK